MATCGTGTRLRWGHFVVKDDAIALHRLRLSHQLRRFPFADDVPRIELANHDAFLGYHANAQGFHEFLQFIEQVASFVCFAAVKVAPHQQRTLDHLGLIADIKHDVTLESIGAGARPGGSTSLRAPVSRAKELRS